MHIKFHNKTLVIHRFNRYFEHETNRLKNSPFLSNFTKKNGEFFNLLKLLHLIKNGEFFNLFK